MGGRMAYAGILLAGELGNAGRVETVLLDQEIRVRWVLQCLTQHNHRIAVMAGEWAVRTAIFRPLLLLGSYHIPGRKPTRRGERRGRPGAAQERQLI